LCGLKEPAFSATTTTGLSISLAGKVDDKVVVTIGEISGSKTKVFDIKQPVFFLDFDWQMLLHLVSNKKITYGEVVKFPAVQRDLALIVSSNVTYNQVESTVKKVNLAKLQQVELFDIFESEKLGENKKSMAVSFTFIDEAKTLTDKEIDGMMLRLIQTFEKDIGAEIRK
jgi:phenylalanyl-tRNA synthetase beta chain